MTEPLWGRMASCAPVGYRRLLRAAESPHTEPTPSTHQSFATTAAFLQGEAIYFHRHFFHADPPAGVVERYIAANQLCLPSLDQLGQRLVSTVVSRQLDPEAVEAILRLRRKNSVLTRKIQILFYLVEVRSSYYPYFVNSPTGRIRASLELLTSAAQTAWKLTKGLYLVQRHGLV